MKTARTTGPGIPAAADGRPGEGLAEVLGRVGGYYVPTGRVYEVENPGPFPVASERFVRIEKNDQGRWEIKREGLD